MNRCAVLLVIGALMIAAGCRQNPAPPRSGPNVLFEDVAAASGIDFRQQNGADGQYRYIEVLPGGVAMFDYDNDGWLDLFFVQSGSSGPPGTVADRPFCRLYHNRGDGTFQDVTKNSGFDQDLGYAHGVAVGDADGDGYDDLFLTSLSGNRLFHNEAGKGRFQDATRAAGLDRKHSTGYATSAVFGDLDGDGRPELFVCYYAPWTWETDLRCQLGGLPDYCPPGRYGLDTCRLYQNVGGRFVDVTRRSGVDRIGGRALVAAFRDFDGDGKPDILVGNDLTGNLLWRNKGRLTFEERSLDMGLSVRADGQRMATMGIATADIELSGQESVYMTDFAGASNSLFTPLSAGLYEEVSARAGLAAATLPYVAFGCAFLDIDADGAPDLATANGHVTEHADLSDPAQTLRQPQQLFRNVGKGRFSEILGPPLGALGKPALGRGLAAGDLDNDGRVDLVLVRQNDTPLVLRNRDLGTNHWISIRLVGKAPNTNAWHARVNLTVDGKRRTAQVEAGSSYLSVGDRRLYFGLGKADRIDKAEILWPGGGREEIVAPPVDTFVTVTQGQGITQRTSPNPKLR